MNTYRATPKVFTPLKKLTHVVLFWLLAFQLNAQNFEWAAKLGGTDVDEGWSIAADASGNVYTAGTFKGTADFNPGAGVNQLTSNGQTDFFISKVNSSGTYQWAVQFGGTGSEGTKPTVKTDPSGNVYLAGSFRNTVDFNPGADTNEVTSNGGSLDGFIVKLNSSGVFQWVKTITGTSNINLRNLRVDGSGNAYVTGDFSGTVDFRPEGAAVEETAQANNDSFVMKVSAAGALSWAKVINTNSLIASYGIALDASNNVYTSGTYYGTADFDPGAGTASLSSAGGTDAFITKWNSDGEYIWAKKFGGSSNAIGEEDDVANAIAVDNDGNVVITGFFRSTADFDPGAGAFEITSTGIMDIFVSKLDTDGNFVWATALPGPGNNVGYDITIDAAGSIYSTGQFAGQVDFDPGVNFHNLSASGAEFDIYVSKLKPDGSFAAAFKLGSTLRDRGYGIAVDGDYNIYTTGYFNGGFDFDPSSGVSNLSSTGSSDAFILKMSQPVYIPDANFKAALLANASINTTNDGEISYDEAEAFTGTLNVGSKSISDLTGIEAFINITKLYCYDNDLTSLNTTYNTAINDLQCWGNLITSLDLTANTSLTSFVALENELTAIDVTNNPLLTNIRLGDNHISSIDLSNNPLLQTLELDYNDLTELDISSSPLITRLLIGENLITSINLSNQTLLTEAYIQNCDLTEVDFSNNTALVSIWVQGNQLTTLDVSVNTNLVTLIAQDNFITSLDVSNNSLLQTFTASRNGLEELNIKNGNNEILNTFSITDNPLLTCVTVDDVAYAEANFTNIDPQTGFSTLCNSVNIPDANFKAALLANTFINTTDDGEISFEEAEAFTGSLTIREISIADLTGIEAFVNLTSLDCYGNQLEALDLSANTELINTNCSGNLLTTINVNGLDKLETLYLANNLLTSIDVSDNIALTELGGNGNQLTTLDVSNNINLVDIGLYENQLTSLDVSSCSALLYLEVYDNQLTALDISSNTLLVGLSFDNNALTSLNIANGNNANFEFFTAEGNPDLTCITVDDVPYAEANFTDVDVVANFSTNCSNTANDILTFSFVEQVNAAVIDAMAHTVEIEVAEDADFTNLTPTFTISAGATVDPLSGVAQDFSGSFIYTVTSQNPSVTQQWTINAILPKQQQVITFGVIENQFLESKTLTLSASASSGLPVVFEIIDGPASIAGNTLTMTATGQVTVKATQPGDATYVAAAPVEQSFEIILITSVPEQRGPQFKYYPNPVSGTITIIPNGSKNQLTVFDTQGRSLTSGNGNSNEAIQLDLSALPSGIYVLRVANEAGVSQIKILKK